MTLDASKLDQYAMSAPIQLRTPLKDGDILLEEVLANPELRAQLFREVAEWRWEFAIAMLKARPASDL